MENSNHSPSIFDTQDEWSDGLDALVGAIERLKGDLRVEMSVSGDKDMKPALDVCDDIIIKLGTLQQVVNTHLIKMNKQ